MKFIYTVFAFVLMSICSSCKKFLDTKPQDFLSPVTYYQTEEQLNNALTAVYQTLADLNTYGNSMQSYMALDADEGFFRRTGGVQVNNVVPTDPMIRNLWATFYRGIERANLLLENIDKPVMSDSARSVIKGETLFLRAYFYFVLVSHFGDVPLKLTATTSPNDPPLARTPAKEVYAQILKDMSAAEQMVLPIDKIGYGGRVSRSAVEGILARVCLYMAGNPINDVSKYGEAKAWAQKVINSGLHDLNPSYQQVFINYAQDKYDIKESIWEVEFWGNSAAPYKQGGRVGTNFGVLYSAPTTTSGVSYGWVFSSDWLYYSYADGDQRRDWNIAPYTLSHGNEVPRPLPVKLNRYAGKWYRKYELPTSDKTNANTPENFALLRYSDVLLMFAEAENELNGPTQEAYETLNQVLRRAFGKPVHVADPTIDLQPMTKDSMRSYIQVERSRELCFEGMRKMDLVRWGIFMPRMQVGVAEFSRDMPTSSLVEYFTNAKDRDVLWPIPSTELALNSALVQNPGW